MCSLARMSRKGRWNFTFRSALDISSELGVLYTYLVRAGMSRFMVTKTAKADSKLAKRLWTFTDADPDYWSFRRNAMREHSHGMFQYPAMMVPQMQSRLIGEIIAVDSGVRCIYDPFVGAGTVLTEAMLRGLSFQGCDINPLAVLVSRVKTGPFFVEALQARWQGVKARSQGDGRKEVECNYTGWRKWFTIGVAIKLTRLARAIRSEDASGAGVSFGLPWQKRYV